MRKIVNWLWDVVLTIAVIVGLVLCGMLDIFIKIKKKIKERMAKIKICDVTKGDKFRLKNGNYAHMGLNAGDIVTDSGQRGNSNNIIPVEAQIWIPLTMLEKLDETKEEIEKRIKKMETEIANEKAKIDWMTKTGNDKYDETEFKVWNTLQTLNSKSTDIEKAKIIAELIRK